MAALAAVLLLCAALTACSGGAGDRPEKDVTPSPTEEPTPAVSVTDAPAPDVYLSEQVSTLTQGSVTIRVTTHLNVDGEVTDSVTEQKDENASDSVWTVTERRSFTSENGVTQTVTEMYSSGKLQSRQTERTEDNGQCTVTYDYYSDDRMTEQNVDEIDADGRLTRTKTMRFDGAGLLIYLREVRYAEDAYAVPLYEEISKSDAVTQIRECAENRRLEATETQPALYLVSDSALKRMLLVIGSFRTEITVSKADDTSDEAGKRTICTLAEMYDGCDSVALYYSEDGKNDLVRAGLGTGGKYNTLVWDCRIREHRRTETDQNGSFRRIDVRGDGTEVVRYERVCDSERRTVSEKSYDSLGNITSSRRVERSDDGHRETVYELVMSENGRSVTRVKCTEYNDNGLPGSVESYTQDGDAKYGVSQWEYSYDERGSLASGVYTSAAGTSVKTTYRNTYSPRG